MRFVFSEGDGAHATEKTRTSAEEDIMSEEDYELVSADQPWERSSWDGWDVSFIGGWIDVVAIITLSDENPYKLIIGEPGDLRILSIVREL